MKLICDFCNKVWKTKDRFELVRCENGHTLCKLHIINDEEIFFNLVAGENFSDKGKAIFFEERKDTFLESSKTLIDLFNVIGYPEKFCPICNKENCYEN